MVTDEWWTCFLVFVFLTFLCKPTIISWCFQTFLASVYCPYHYMIISIPNIFFFSLNIFLFSIKLHVTPELPEFLTDSPPRTFLTQLMPYSGWSLITWKCSLLKDGPKWTTTWRYMGLLWTVTLGDHCPQNCFFRSQVTIHWTFDDFGRKEFISIMNLKKSHWCSYVTRSFWATYDSASLFKL